MSVHLSYNLLPISTSRSLKLGGFRWKLNSKQEKQLTRFFSSENASFRPAPRQVPFHLGLPAGILPPHRIGVLRYCRKCRKHTGHKARHLEQLWFASSCLRLCVYFFPLLGLKDMYHYWTFVFLMPGSLSRWKLGWGKVWFLWVRISSNQIGLSKLFGLFFTLTQPKLPLLAPTCSLVHLAWLLGLSLFAN